jgi:hypothetical protein
VIVGDSIDVEKIPERLENNPDTRFDAIRKCWKGVNAGDKIIFTENREVKEKIKEKAEAEEKAQRENQFNIYIQSKWKLPENCEHCFPTNNPIYERPLFVTDKVSVTPSLIFEPPKWYEPEPIKVSRPYFKFDKDKTPLDKLPIIKKIDWVHYTGDSNKHFNYYLHYLDFLHENEKILRKWASKSIKGKFAGEKENNVLLIASDKAENGSFIHLINREIFDDRAEVIRFDKHSDHYSNFDKFFKYKISWADTIYFVDNLMLSGKTFFSVDDILKISQEREQGKNQNEEPKQIKGIFCLINRMDYSCYHAVAVRLKENNEIRREKATTDNEKKSKYESTSEDEENYLYSFIQLNVPESVIIPCPLCDEKTKYVELKDNASLDCVKQYFVEKEMPYFKQVDKEELTEGDLPYKPLTKNHNSTLLRVTLIHFLNKAFAENHNCIERLKIGKLPQLKDDYKEYLDFNKFINEFRDYISKQKQSCIKGKDENDDIINDLKFKANLIKVLSAQSFKKYRGVYISVFYWVLCELIVAARTILGKDYDFEGTYDILTKKENADKLTDFSILAPDAVFFTKIDSFIDTVNYLRMLVKYASSLNIAYLLHQDFLAAINKLINRKDEIVKKIRDEYRRLGIEDRNKVKRKYKEMRYSFQNFKLFCAAHIIRSLYKNEQRAIQFEKNIIILYNKFNGKDTTFLELLTLENTSTIRQTLDNIEKVNVSELDPMDHQLDDFFAFGAVKQEDRKPENEKFKKLKYTCDIRKKIRRYEKNSETSSTDYGNDREINDIIKYIAEIIGCNETGGGILLYKYQHLKEGKEFENYRVLGKYGDDPALSDYFESLRTDSFSTKFLEGIVYLEETKKDINKPTAYNWTNYAIHKNDDGVWVGQDEKPAIIIDKNGYEYSDFTDIQSIRNKANRMFFIRISSYHKDKDKYGKEKEELKGEAVFIFYDNDNKTKGHDSIHDTRFVHILRNDISKYLKDKYHNDAFKAWVEERKFLNAPDHNYYNILSELKNYRNDNDKYEFLYTLLMVKKEIHEILKTKTVNLNAKEIYSFDLSNQINFYCSNMFKAGEKPTITNEAFTIKFHEPLFRHIMYEYLRNARKGAKPEDINIELSTDNNDEYKISILNRHEYVDEDNQLLARKKLLEQCGYTDSSKIKGLYLNYLLLEAAGSPPRVDVKLDNDMIEFKVSFTLKNL